MDFEQDEQELTSQEMLEHSGFCALVGRPNVGKSTLVNACLGKKIAITSPVAQTTRKRLRAVVEREGTQLIIIDTPGLHKPKDELGKELNKTALSEFAEADVIAFLVDATAKVGAGDAWVARHVAATPDAYKLLVITKADLVDQNTATEQLEAARALADFDDELIISAVEDFNVDGFIELVSAQLPRGPRWFPEDMTYDASDEDMVAELIREKLYERLKQELPHALAVVCDKISYAKDGHASIVARVLVERESQKGIVVGDGASMIKSVGIAARKDIEKFLGCKVYLDLSVSTSPAWRRDANVVRKLGYAAQD